MGIGSTTNYSSPIQIGTATDWADEGISLTRNYYSGAYIKGDGKLWCWGFNYYGETGNGTTALSSAPQQIGALTDWQTVSANSRFKHAVKTDGTLWAWGKNAYGNLGLGDATNRSSPVQVGALTDWGYAVFSQGWFGDAMSVKSDGTLWGWGLNAYGELGLGDGAGRNSPVQVGALTTWSDVAGGQYFHIAVKTDGTLWAMGRNNKGQLGTGNTTSYNSPVQVGALTDWESVEATGDSSLAKKTDGTIWSWGSADDGRLGLNTATAIDYSSPVQIGAETDWGLITDMGGLPGGGGIRSV